MKNDIGKIMKKRWKTALKMPCRAILFDIDKNLSDESGNVSKAVIAKLAAIVAEKKSILGFVSGRPERTKPHFVREGREIMIVAEQVMSHIPKALHDRLMIFPEHAGYGKNLGTGEYYDFGFESWMKTFPLRELEKLLSQTDWFDHNEVKKTGIAIWVKNQFRNKSDIDAEVRKVVRWAHDAGLSNDIKIMNGANRTVDILLRSVNKKRAVSAIGELFKIPVGEIATSDDQADINQTGHDFVDIPLGFATNEFDPHYQETEQIVTSAAFGMTKTEANLHIMKNLLFVPAF